VGQRVLTSGLSRRYVRGIPVGSVVRVERDPRGLTQQVEVEPAARFSRLRHAFVAPQPPPLEGTR
jgi:rod shape-determining protein MreC